jgi:hypothetical protein
MLGWPQGNRCAHRTTCSGPSIRCRTGDGGSGGLLCVRVNAVGTDVWPSHEVVERGRDDGFSVRYTAGPKNGLTIHFFSAAELDTLFTGWTPVLPLRAHRTERTPPGVGQWTQWEAIWRRP